MQTDETIAYPSNMVNNEGNQATYASGPSLEKKKYFNKEVV